MVGAVPESLSNDSYTRLLRFRTGLRRFEKWSEQQAEAAGLTSAQHQLLLAVRGHPDRRGPTVGEIAEYLMLRHHSVVELVDRAVAAGLVRRVPDSHDRRLVRVRATTHGTAVLRRLSRAHVAELARLAPAFEVLWAGLEPTKHLPPDQRTPARVAPQPQSKTGSERNTRNRVDS
jgi:DNA-binding MarR family transcriptional regulator